MASKTICSLEPLSDEARQIISKSLNCEVEIIPRTFNTTIHASEEILICRDRDDWKKIFELFPSLRFVFIVSVGVERLPFKELIDRKIKVASPKGINAEIMSEYAIAGILAHSTRLFENINNQNKHYWKKFQCVDSLQGKVLLIVGAGHAGSLLAVKAKSFGMHTVGVKKHLQPDVDYDKIITLTELNTILPVADYVVCTIPLTSETRHLFRYEQFASMKSTAYFINISRGGILVQEELVRALKENKISGAMLDVFEKEPLLPNDKLWDIPNLQLTPHSSGRLENFINKTVPYIISNIKAFWLNDELPNSVNLHDGY